MKKFFLFALVGIFFMLSFSFVSAARLPTVGGDEGVWGTVLNDYLNVSLNESGEIRPANLTFAQKVTFAFGEIIDNVVDGWITITGNLKVTEDAVINKSLNVTENINAEGNMTADYFIGDGSQLTGISSGGGGLISDVNITSGTYTGAITSGGDTGYKAADDICDSEFSGSHFCTEFEVATWSSKSIDGEDAWVIAGSPKYVPADIPVNDCNGWTHGSAGTYLGNYWHFGSTTGGDGRAIQCGTSLKLACCSY
ncbi:MAG: hypothetical protein PHG05_00260 [Candidatus Nanoarchaeia archaeon]|nr:hypothetical protein [Candidatus Nanoarchaeia archaeon]